MCKYFVCHVSTSAARVVALKQVHLQKCEIKPGLGDTIPASQLTASRCPHLVDEYEHDEGAHRGPDLGDHAAGEEVARVPAQPRHRHLQGGQTIYCGD